MNEEEYVKSWWDSLSAQEEMFVVAFFVFLIMLILFFAAFGVGMMIELGSDIERENKRKE